MSAYLPYLLLLACPIAMFLMMRGMHGRGGQRDILEAPSDADVAALSEQRDRLEARVEELEAQMSSAEWHAKTEPRVQTPA
jgi:hypothetical protein